MPAILIYTGIISLVIYLIYIVIFRFGLKKDKNGISFIKRTVSVVIAARNEEKNISNLLTGLINQSYPHELYEIIVVNDRSEDNTARIVEQFSAGFDNIILINVAATPKDFSPKKYALTRGIKAAKGEVLMLTDADCLVNKYWVESMVSMFTDDTDLVVGFSRTKIADWSKASFCTRYEFFDFLVMFIAAAGAILSGRAFSCSNQNLSYRRSSFFRVGGFEKIKHITSGDDVNLLQLFRKEKMKARFSLIPHSFVYTKPVSGWTQFINQRARWASNSKWQLILNPEFFIYLLSVFMLNVTVLTAIFLHWQSALILFTVKVICEYIFISSTFNLFEKERKRLSFLPVWSLIQPFYILIVTILGLFNIFIWKPRSA